MRTYKPATYICINLVLVFLIVVILLHFGPVCLRIQVNKENKEFKVKKKILVYFDLCVDILKLKPAITHVSCNPKYL